MATIASSLGGMIGLATLVGLAKPLAGVGSEVWSRGILLPLVFLV